MTQNIYKISSLVHIKVPWQVVIPCVNVDDILYSLPNHPPHTHADTYTHL